MSGRPWYKHYPSNFITGCLNLSLEEIGAYIIILDHIYDRGGPVPNDTVWLARSMGGCHPNKALNLVRLLVEKGKIFKTEDGMLSNKRAVQVMRDGDREEDGRREGGRNGGRKQAENRRKLAENNDLAETQLEHTRRLEARSQNSIDSPSGNLPTDAGAKPPDHDAEAKAKADAEIQQAFDAWNTLAGELELPTARSLDKKRRAGISARLRENGGLDAWNAALAALKAAPFLCGQGKEGWRANIDFVCQAGSFRKLIEGAYTPAKGPSQLALLTPIPGGKVEDPPDPNDKWGIEAWCKSIGAEPLDNPKGKWKYNSRIIDLTARTVAEAAGFSSKLRPDWSPLKAWVDDGIPTDQIASVVRRMAEYFASKGNPATNLSAFDKKVRERMAA
jgi:uncharacterized protein YdaU (DUF1376 family)